MSKGEITHQAIIEKAAQVFSMYGYAGTSMSHLMRATKLSKGAIYNQFKDKDDLAIQAFDYSMERVQEIMRGAIRRAPKHAIHRMVAVVKLFRNYVEHSEFEGGCPMLATSVEVDDTHPELRERAQIAMNGWRFFLKREVERGIEEGQVRADADPNKVADIIIAGLEGGIMMSKLYGNSDHINRVVEHLIDYLETQVATL